MALVHGRKNPFAFSWTAPLGGGSHGPAIRGKPDKGAFVCVSLPGQLADVELAGSPHLSRSSVTDVGILLHPRSSPGQAGD